MIGTRYREGESMPLNRDSVRWIAAGLVAIAVGVGAGVAVGVSDAPLPTPVIAAPAPDRAVPAAQAPAQGTAPQPAPPAAAPEPPAEQMAALVTETYPVEEVAPTPAPVVPPTRPVARPNADLAWVRNAVRAPDTGRPMIAVVIDDLGLNAARTARFNPLPGPLTLSFLSYADNLPAQTAAARAAGHELMLHMPMEPLNDAIDPGPRALTVDLPAAEIAARLRWGLERFDGMVGVNNHMGSRFTADADAMATVMDVLDEAGLLFLDSRTSGQTTGVAMAAEAGIPHAGRDVFLDHQPTPDFVRDSLATVEDVARRHGSAIAIGHPHDVTIAALAAWLPGLRSRGFDLVPVSAVVASRMGLPRPGVRTARR